MSASSEAADLQAEERVQRLRNATPRERAQMVRTIVARMHELLADAEWIRGFLSDMHDDAYPPGCGKDCEPCCGLCREADKLAGKDQVVSETAALFKFWDELEDLARDLLAPDAELWAVMESRLDPDPAASPWAALQRKIREHEAAGR